MAGISKRALIRELEEKGVSVPSEKLVDKTPNAPVRLKAKEEIAISPETEVEKKIEMQEKIETLAELSQKLSALQERAGIEAKIKDIKFVQKMDEFAELILDALTEEKETLKTAIKNMIITGNMTKLRELMTAFGITVDKREQLLSFDQSRAANRSKRKLKLQVVWRNNDGDTSAVQAEVEE